MAVLYILKITKNLSFNFFKNFLIPKGRGNISKIKFKNKKIFLIDESYNSNPLSLSSAISTARSTVVSNTDVAETNLSTLIRIYKHIYQHVSTIYEIYVKNRN